MNPISPTTTYQTRDGREVRIYAVDGAGHFPVHGATKESDGWVCRTWAANGLLSHQGEKHATDLLPIPRYRAWRDGEMPRVFPVRQKVEPRDTGLAFKQTGYDACVRVYPGSPVRGFKEQHLSAAELFDDFLRITESGEELPCGVRE